MEVWKDVPGYEGRYQVSNLARVKSTRKYYQERILLPSTTGTCKYKTVSLGGKTLMVHRLVAICFCENPLNKPFVNHKDGNKYNNDADNLEWVTFQENMDHANAAGLMHKAKGVRHHKSRLTPNDIFNIRFSRNIQSIPFHIIAEFYGISKQSVMAIINGKNWAHV